MNDSTALAPGMMVHGTNGAVGTVERLDTGAGNGQAPAFFVRSADGQRLYRLPMELVRRVRQEDGRPVALLNTGADMLDSYLVGRTAPAYASHEAKGEARARADMPADEWSPQGAEDATLRIPLVAEELTVETQPINLGNVHIHKGVETVEQRITIPVTREETIIEHIAPENYDANIKLDPDEIVIPVMEERLVYEKRAFVKEYIRVRKNRVTENQDISGELRREYVEVVEQPAAADPEGAPLFRVTNNKL